MIYSADLRYERLDHLSPGVIDFPIHLIYYENDTSIICVNLSNIWSQMVRPEMK